MLFGETVAVYCENHKEHIDTARTSQETLRLRYRAQPVNAVWETVAVYCENHTEHTNM
jgi:hypothetical protein